MRLVGENSLRRTGFRSLVWMAVLAVPASITAFAAEQSPAKTPKLPPTPFAYADVQLPDHFPSFRSDNTPSHNPVTDHGATLGRVLFYDPGLSSTGKISCGSCHRQKNAFADPRRVSRGIKGKRGTRNAQGLTNARFHPTGRFFWDERAETLEDQVLMPIEHPKEMNNTMDRVVLYLDSNPVYHDLFGKAFGDPFITTERVSLALAQFVRSMVSYRSKFDVGMAQADSIQQDFPNFTDKENEGKSIFLGLADNTRGNCASCHLTRTRGGPGSGGPRNRGDGNGRLDGKFAIFMGPQPQNNGLESKLDKKDNGVGDQTGEAEDMGLFKSPSLRNVELTAPYMHDGRFKTLEQVIDHYSKNVKAHPNLHPRLAGRGDRGPRLMNLTSQQKSALVAFLKTLTDHEFIKDPRFSDPFR